MKWLASKNPAVVDLYSQIRTLLLRKNTRDIILMGAPRVCSICLTSMRVNVHVVQLWLIPETRMFVTVMHLVPGGGGGGGVMSCTVWWTFLFIVNATIYFSPAIGRTGRCFTLAEGDFNQ